MAETRCLCSKERREACIRSISVFSGLEENEVEWLCERVVRREYTKGTIFYEEGTIQQHLVIINKGRVKAFRSNYEGREQIAYIFSPGDFYGVMNLLENSEARFSLEALEDVGVCLISKGDFEALLEKYPDVSIRVIKELCLRLDKMETLLNTMGIRDADMRIYSMILEFLRKFGEKRRDGVLITLPLTREGMANYIGVARETLSRKLAALQDEGIIQILGGRNILVRDVNALENMLQNTYM